MKERSKYKNNTSGIKGVYWYKPRGLWVARATFNNKKYHLGYFFNQHDAKTAFDAFYESHRSARIASQEKHGRYKERAYASWASMKRRCNNMSQHNYHLYGGRGISYIDKWESFDSFYEDMGDCPPGCSLDRKENNKGYSKENCRWATVAQQANNKRTNALITAFGKTQTLSAWSEEVGLKRSTIRERVYTYGWTVEDSLTLRPWQKKPRIVHSKKAA